MSGFTVEPGAVRTDVPNRFTAQQLEFPVFGLVAGIPSNGTSLFVMEDENLVCIALFVPDEACPPGKPAAMVTGLSAKEAHRIGTQLIDAAMEIAVNRVPQ